MTPRSNATNRGLHNPRIRDLDRNEGQLGHGDSSPEESQGYGLKLFARDKAVDPAKAFRFRCRNRNRIYLRAFSTRESFYRIIYS